jgi:hypothetical protein
MFSEILKIIPQLDNSDLNKMDRQLTKRFGAVAKKFGKGLLATLAGGGLAGIALGFIEKILNPLKETQEAIDRTLKLSDDIVTNAKQFGTTPGKLFKLQALGKANGIDPESLSMLINKFQTAVSEATYDPTKPTSVRNYVPAAQLDEKGNQVYDAQGKPKFHQIDQAENFFGFIQDLRRMTKDQQLLVQEEVFGEKQVLKMSDFLDNANQFGAQLKRIGAQSSEVYTKPLEKLSGLNDKKDELTAGRELNDLLVKARKINEGMIDQQGVAEQLALNKENQRVAKYNGLATIDATVTRIMNQIEGVALNLTTLLVKVTNLSDISKKLSASRMFKGIFGSEDK